MQIGNSDTKQINKKTTKKEDRFYQSVSETFSKIENNKALTYTHQNVRFKKQSELHLLKIVTDNKV